MPRKTSTDLVTCEKAFAVHVDKLMIDFEGTPEQLDCQLAIARSFWNAAFSARDLEAPTLKLVDGEQTAQAAKVLEISALVNHVGEQCLRLVEASTHKITDGGERWLAMGRIFSGLFQNHFAMSIVAADNQLAREDVLAKSRAKAAPPVDVI